MIRINQEEIDEAARGHCVADIHHFPHAVRQLVGKYN
jgi:hypothetical protein